MEVPAAISAMLKRRTAVQEASRRRRLIPRMRSPDYRPASHKSSSKSSKTPIKAMMMKETWSLQGWLEGRWRRAALGQSSHSCTARVW